MDLSDLVEHLAEEDFLGAPDESPWRSCLDLEGEWDLYEVDHAALFGGRGEPYFYRDIQARGRELDGGEEFGRPTGGDAEAAKERRPDVCAWYQPIHFYGFDWGIFMLDDCLVRIAADIARFLPPTWKPHFPWEVDAPLRMAFASLFLHEAYHHKTEAFAIRLQVTEKAPRYRTYHAAVYRSTTDPPADHLLEEALANADSYHRVGQTPYRRWVPTDVYRAARSYLTWRFPLDPPGYREATNYLTRDSYAAGEWTLKAQVQQASTYPTGDVSVWNLAPKMNASIFGLASNIWTIVPRGTRPALPVFPLYRPVSTDAVEKALKRKFAYDRVKGGTGSHLKLKAEGSPTVILPGNRSELSPVVMRNVARALGYRELDELYAELGL